MNLGNVENKNVQNDDFPEPGTKSELALNVLECLNQDETETDVIGTILALIKQHTELESVGIRLKKGGYYPYYRTIGFNEGFLDEENETCVQTGGAEDSKPACLCGIVIEEKIDSKVPFFTDAGSFWTNDFLKASAEMKTIVTPGNKCLQSGYRSTAIIPLRSHGVIVGLMQLYDRREDRFTPDSISFFERLGLSIGLSISRRQKEEEIRRLLSELDLKNKELQAIAYSMSHDLKNPISSIFAMAHLLMEENKGEKDKETKEMANNIAETALGMESMIEILIDYAASGNADKHNFEMVMFNELIESSLDVLEEEIARKGIKIIFKSSPEKIYGEKELLQRVFDNLLSNSVKYIGTDNTDPQIEIGVKDMDGEKAYYVKDNGIGIGNKEIVFDLLKRLPNDQKASGTGVGLTIVKRVVESHGGRIWIESEQNAGSAFYITFPH